MTGEAEASAGGALGRNDVVGKGAADAQGCTVGADGPVTVEAALT